MIAGAWNRFWHERGSPRRLAVFRMLFAVCLLLEIDTTRRKSLFAIEGGFHLPYIDGLPLLPEQVYHLVHDLQYPLVVLVALGLLMRPACAGLLILQGYVFFADQLNFRNHPYFFLLLLVLLLLSPADEALSIRAWWRARKGKGTRPPDPPLTFHRLIQVQVCIAYFFSGLQKLHPAYLRGEVLSDQLSKNLLRGDSGDVLGWLLAPASLELLEQFVARPGNVAVLAVATVALELSLPFALWHRRARNIAVPLGVGFHLSIAFFFGIRVFSLAMVASYLLFSGAARSGRGFRVAGDREAR